MKKSLIKTAVFTLTFLLSLFIISGIMNQGNTDMTIEMSQASFPLIFMNIDGERVNCLHGYAQEMEGSYLRDTITVIPQGRTVQFEIEKFNTDIQKVSYELRSVDGERLVENGEITNKEENGEEISASVTLKDLIETKTEYNLIFLLETEMNEIRYYTRVILAEDYAIDEKIAFVKDFHRKTFDKEAAKDLTKYLESNAEGDNTTYAKVDIHSSFNQITWGELSIEKVTEPVMDVKEIASQTGSFQLDYIVATAEGRNRTYYNVEEYYRVRYTPDRIYLLDFERTMEQILNEEADIYAANKILVGIADSDVQLVESDGGNIFAFVNSNRLYSYNVTDNKLAAIYGFYDEKNADTRTMYDHNGIQILGVDETGNVWFMVYGYMNRGRHEGGVGIQICNYNSQTNTVEEELYIPYQKSYQVLQSDVEQLSYISKNNQFYVMLDRAIYAIDLTEKTYEVLASDLYDESYQISESNAMIVWQDSEERYDSTTLVLMNLNSKKRTEIKAGAGEVIAPLGFMGEDLIYGLARNTDIVKDETGRVTFPMYKVIIQDELGRVLHTYQQNGAYVIGSRIEDNQITLIRVSKDENDEYEEIENDQIMSTEIAEVGDNYVETVITESYEKIVQIAVKSNIDSKSLQILTPREVLFEGGRELVIDNDKEENDFYYVYGKDGIAGRFMNPGSAVNLAYSISGVVVNDKGGYVWQKGNRSIKNQIMAITGTEITEEKNSMAVCLDTILKFEGIMRNTEYQLNKGGTVIGILEENLPQAQILDLTGCSLDAILYYVNKDIPVLATLNDGNAVLVIGFNELNIVVMDPLTGMVYKKGMNDSTAWFEENGNCFITYVME
ncbi:MAG: hypothetical protein K2K54_09075 [Lachnospiraceae bacterium]|nr:hypothetical protein [Lachnospiraceae bacterium]